MWKISQNRSDLEKLLKYLNDNDLEWVTQVLKEKMEKVEGKPTHYLEVDEWKPIGVKEKNDFKPVVAEKKILDSHEESFLPF